MVKDTKYYDILGVIPSASEKEIKKAFHKKALHAHPDKGGCEENFKELNAAYETLSDPEKRKLYDLHGEKYDNEMENGMNMNDIFGNMFGQQHERRSTVSNINKSITISLEDAYSGKPYNVEYERISLCSKCDGTGSNSGRSYKCSTCRGQGHRVVIRQIGPGMIQQMQLPCNECKGTGEIKNINDVCNKCTGTKYEKEQHVFKFDIEPGVGNNVRVCIKNEGNQDFNSKIRSDLVVTINVEKHDIYERHENDLIITTNIDLLESLYGFKRVINHINGEKIWFHNIVSQNVSPIKNGEHKIIPNYGMPAFRQNRHGNLVVKFNVLYPSYDLIKNNVEQFSNLLNSAYQIPSNISNDRSCVLVNLIDDDSNDVSNDSSENENEHDNGNEDDRTQQCRTH